MAGKINPYDYEPEYSDDEDIGNVNVDNCEIRNAADVMSDCSEGNSPLSYLDNSVGKPPTDWCQSGTYQSMGRSLPSSLPPSLPLCLSAPPPFFSTQPSDCNQIWHAYVD